MDAKIYTCHSCGMSTNGALGRCPVCEKELWELESEKHLALQKRHYWQQILVHAVTEYDRKQEKRKGYNRYALAQYLSAVRRTIEQFEQGQHDIETCVSLNFLDGLCKFLIKSVRAASVE